MPDLIWNGSLCAQTVFFDDFEVIDLEPMEGPAPAETQLTSSASWEVDNLTWHQTVSEAVTNEALRDLSYCSGTPVNAFMNGEFGGVKKYAEWLGKPEAQVIGKHRDTNSHCSVLHVLLTSVFRHAQRTWRVHKTLTRAAVHSSHFLWGSPRLLNVYFTRNGSSTRSATATS